MRWSVLVDSCQQAVAVGRRRPIHTALVLSLAIAAGVAPTRLIGKGTAADAAGTVPVTDLGMYAEPALVGLPAAGGTLLDSVFHTPLMRLTDGNDGTDCRVEYWYWPTFNVDSTRAKALCVINGVNRTRIWTFDQVAFTRGTSSTLMPQLLQSTDPIWSHSAPNLIYGHSQTHLLLTYDAAAQTTATVKDFSSLVPSGGQLQQMSISADDNVFAFHLTNSAGAEAGYVVWKRRTDTVLLNRAETGIDEVQIDKTGRYLTVVYKSGNGRVWDLQAVTSADVTWGVDGFFHHDSGRSMILTDTGTTTPFGYRLLSSPHSVVSLLTLTNAGNKTSHVSMGAENEAWGLVSRYTDNGSPVSSPFDNEIFQVTTDGSSKVRRIAHHRSVFNDYYDAPFANISKDGRLVAFSSNWGNANGRRDVFVAHIEAAPTSGTTRAPAAPQNVRVMVSSGG